MVARGKVELTTVFNKEGIASGMSAVKGEMDQTLRSLDQTLLGVGSALAGSQVVVFFKDCLMYAEQFDDKARAAEATIRHLGATGQVEMGRLRDEFRKLAIEKGAEGPGDVAETYRRMAGGVWGPAGAQKEIGTVLDANIAGYDRYGDSVTAAGRTMQVFDIQGNKTEEVLSKLAVAADKSMNAVGYWDDATRLMQRFAPSLKAGEVSLDEFLAVTATMEAKGEGGRAMLAGFGTVIETLKNEAPKAGVAYTGLLSTMKDLKDKGISMDELTPDPRQQDQLNLLIDSYDEIAANMGDVSVAAGTLKRDTAAAMDDAGFRMMRAKALTNEFKLAIGSDLSDAVLGTHKTIDDFLKELGVLGVEVPDSIEKVTGKFSLLDLTILGCFRHLEDMVDIGKDYWTWADNMGKDLTGGWSFVDAARKKLGVDAAAGDSYFDTPEAQAERARKAEYDRRRAESLRKYGPIAETPEERKAREEKEKGGGEGGAREPKKPEADLSVWRDAKARRDAEEKFREMEANIAASRRGKEMAELGYDVTTEEATAEAVDLAKKGYYRLPGEQGGAGEKSPEMMNKEAAKDLARAMDPTELITAGLTGEEMNAAVKQWSMRVAMEFASAVSSRALQGALGTLLSFIPGLGGVKAFLGFQHGGRTEGQPAVIGEYGQAEWGIPENLRGLNLAFGRMIPAIVAKYPELNHALGAAGGGRGGDIYLSMRDIDRQRFGVAREVATGAAAAGSRKL